MFHVNVVVGLVASTKLPPAPLKIVHCPVPVVGVFLLRFALVEHNVWSGPAVATVGGVLKVICTSSLVLAHTPLEIVQRKL